MTAAVFLAALGGAYLWLVNLGWFVAPGITIYVAAFALVMAVAATAAIVSRDRRAIAAAAVLILNLAATHWGWFNGDVLLNQVIIDGLTVVYFTTWGTTRWEWTIAVVYLLSVASALAAQLDWIPGIGERPPIFLAWNYADLTSLCGHAAAIALGAGAGDSGKRIRDFLSVRPMAAGWRRRAVAGMGALAKRASGRVVAED